MKSTKTTMNIQANSRHKTGIAGKLERGIWNIKRKITNTEREMKTNLKNAQGNSKQMEN